MKTFTLRAHLRSPLIRQGFMTLDALLMANLHRGDVSDLLRCEDGLYFASAANLVGTTQPLRTAFVASMRAETTPEWLEVIAPNARSELVPLYDDGTGKLKKTNSVAIGALKRKTAGNVLNAYGAISAAAVEWHAQGDAQAVLDAVSDILFIGKKRTAGFGEISPKGWEIEEGDLNGVRGPYGGSPLRPVPVSRWKEMFPRDLQLDEHIVQETAWKGPYWDLVNRDVCFVPEAA